MENKRTRRIPKCKIDRLRLELELGKRGMTLYAAANRLGFSKSYFYQMFNKDSTLPQRTLLLLQEKFGIRTETIMPNYMPPKDEPIPEQTKQEPKQDDLAKMPEAIKKIPPVVIPIVPKETPDAVTKVADAIYELIRAAAHDGCADAIKELLG